MKSHTFKRRSGALVSAMAAAGMVLASSASIAQTLDDREKAIQMKEQELKALEARLMSMQDNAAAGSQSSLLPDATAGQCFAKVLVPAAYKTSTEQVVKREAGTKIDVVPAKYQTVEEQILISAASEKVEVVAAEFETMEENVMVSPAQMLWRQGRKSNSHLAAIQMVAAAGIPTDAPVGACYVEYYTPPKFESKEEQLVKREAGTKIEIIPAKYEMVEEQVLVKEASEKLVEVAAEYETVEEQVLEAAAYTTWKPGRGPIERIDNSTGEIMCLVEVPAKYKTVQKRVLKSPARSKRVVIPAEYETVRVRKLVSPAQEKVVPIPAEYQTVSTKMLVSEGSSGWRMADSAGPGELTGRTLCRDEIAAQYKTVKKQVLKRPATTRKEMVPAQYKTMKVTKLVTPAQERVTQIPAEYQTVSQRVKVSDETLAWRPVLCETNTSPTLVTDIQRALEKAGFNPGKIDGVIGRDTTLAIDRFQRSKGMETGGLTMNTLEALGVKVN